MLFDHRCRTKFIAFIAACVAFALPASAQSWSISKITNTEPIEENNVRPSITKHPVGPEVSWQRVEIYGDPDNRYDNSDIYYDATSGEALQTSPATPYWEGETKVAGDYVVWRASSKVKQSDKWTDIYLFDNTIGTAFKVNTNVDVSEKSPQIVCDGDRVHISWLGIDPDHATGSLTYYEVFYRAYDTVSNDFADDVEQITTYDGNCDTIFTNKELHMGNRFLAWSKKEKHSNEFIDYHRGEWDYNSYYSSEVYIASISDECYVEEGMSSCNTAPLTPMRVYMDWFDCTEPSPPDQELFDPCREDPECKSDFEDETDDIFVGRGVYAHDVFDDSLPHTQGGYVVWMRSDGEGKNWRIWGLDFDNADFANYAEPIQLPNNHTHLYDSDCMYPKVSELGHAVWEEGLFSVSIQVLLHPQVTYFRNAGGFTGTLFDFYVPNGSTLGISENPDISGTSVVFQRKPVFADYDVYYSDDGATPVCISVEPEPSVWVNQMNPEVSVDGSTTYVSWQGEVRDTSSDPWVYQVFRGTK